MKTLRAGLERGAEFVAAAIFAVMFGAFLLQVFMRYVVNDPLRWSLEVSLIAYVWIVFWSAAFLVKERDHVAFNMFYAAARPALRRVLAILGTAAIGGAFVAAFPATYDFVSFMGIDRTWVLELRFDLVFSVFLLFMIAVILRSALQLGRLFSRRWREHI